MPSGQKEQQGLPASLACARPLPIRIFFIGLPTSCPSSPVPLPCPSNSAGHKTLLIMHAYIVLYAFTVQSVCHPRGNPAMHSCLIQVFQHSLLRHYSVCLNASSARQHPHRLCTLMYVTTVMISVTQAQRHLAN